jgi:cytochrome c-type biogenesis protein CcmF
VALFGRVLILLALGCAAFAVAAALTSRRPGRRVWQLSAERAVYSTAALMSGAMLVMIWALLTDDFSFTNVADYSNSTLSWEYKVGGLWASEAGSLLLFAWILTMYSAFVTWLNRRRHRELMPIVIAVLMTVAGFFALLLSFATSPFNTLAQRPSQGGGLNPLLQNPYMMAHPPILYLGYVGLAIPFAFAIAALWTRRLGTEWITSIRRWTVISWILLAVGILLGARWAYGELGWGGYWAWDPVENAALMPWLMATAFLHSIMVQERRGMLRVWNMVLVIAAYSLSLFGTFLTRSGIVSSIHAFGASTLGPYFLSFIMVVTVASVGLLITRLPDLRSSHSLESFVSREAVFLYNNLLLVGLTFAVFWGTVFPVITQVIKGQSITVGTGYYNQVALPIGLVLLVLTGIGPMIPWRKASWRQLMHRFIAPLVGTAIAGVLLLSLTDAGTSIWASAALIACAFVTICIVGEFWRGTRVRHALGGVSWPMSVYELIARNRRRYGGYVVHLGIVVLIVGLTGSQAFATEHDIALRRGQTASVQGYKFTNLGYTNTSTPNVQETGVVLSESHGGSHLGTLNPTIGFYPASQQRLTEVALDSSPLRDVYVVLVGIDTSGLARLSVYINPLVIWVWVGGLIMLIGGIVAVWPPPRTQRQVAPAAVPEAVQTSRAT